MHTPIQALLHQMKKVPLTNIGPFCDCLLSLCKVMMACIANKALIIFDYIEFMFLLHHVNTMFILKVVKLVY